ncbi:MAG: hypothetical protein M3M94_04965 [Actinomycetota bacterium]|nr:hypothetical protein [Actinomycetota bacterium]
MKIFRTKNPRQVDDLVVVLRQMGYVAHRSGISTVEAYVRSPRNRSRLVFGPGSAAEHRAAS